jgi:phosphopantothenoylcysteine decarboxylase/phosphopantothenate--cysteine ligase
VSRKTLAGKQIVVAVTGSIAAVETVRLIHALRRRGAEVQPVMSAAAAGIIHPDSLTYASERETIARLSGMVEHVTYCGDGGSASLLLIAPCTANTIGKIACGIDDTPVTTFATTALGRGMPVLIVPAMHYSMYCHKGVCENIAKLRSWGIEFVDPRIEEEKAKIADIDEIVLRCERMIMGQPLKGKRILITSGACTEPVDDVRILTTRSSGAMGRAIALQAFRLGADVTVVHRDAIPCVENIPSGTANSMREAVCKALADTPPADLFISAAAISDFAPEQVKGKIPSGAPVSLSLRPLPKLLKEVMERSSSTRIVAFKLGRGQEEKGREMIRSGISIVLVNEPETMGNTKGSYCIISGRGERSITGTKDEIAADLWEEIIAVCGWDRERK